MSPTPDQVYQMVERLCEVWLPPVTNPDGSLVGAAEIAKVIERGKLGVTAEVCGREMRIRIETQRGGPIRYEVTGADWQAVLDVAMVHTDADGAPATATEGTTLTRTMSLSRFEGCRARFENDLVLLKLAE